MTTTQDDILIERLKRQLRDARQVLAQLERDYESEQKFYADQIEYVNALEGRLADLDHAA